MVHTSFSKDTVPTSRMRPDAHSQSHFLSSSSADAKSALLETFTTDGLLEHYQTVLKELTRQALEQQEEINHLKDALAKSENKTSSQKRSVAFEHETCSERDALFGAVDKMVRDAAEHYLKEIDKRLSSSMAQRVRRVTREHVRQSIRHAVEDELARHLQDSNKESVSNRKEPKEDHLEHHEMRLPSQSDNPADAQRVCRETNISNPPKRESKRHFISSNRPDRLGIGGEKAAEENILSPNQNKGSQLFSAMRDASVSTLKPTTNAQPTTGTRGTRSGGSATASVTTPEVSSISSSDNANTWERPNRYNTSHTCNHALFTECLGSTSRELSYDIRGGSDRPHMVHHKEDLSMSSDRKHRHPSHTSRHSQTTDRQLAYQPLRSYPMEGTPAKRNCMQDVIQDDPMNFLLSIFSSSKFGSSEGSRFSPSSGTHRSVENPASITLQSDTTDRLRGTCEPKGISSGSKTNGLSSRSSPAYRSNDLSNSTPTSSFVSEVTFRSKEIGFDEKEKSRAKKVGYREHSCRAMA
ncbi:unnamed protein product [Phytomonas sp. EM1]|nr:unnamed protein product [Phytomonas sp. EM1]|eukprot:CCW60442.1 unnamed protein product [Phytomonas sp. isolate EM1]